MFWLKAVNSKCSEMSIPSLSIICYKNGLSYVNIPVKLGDVKDEEENKVRLDSFADDGDKPKNSEFGIICTNSNYLFWTFFKDLRCDKHTNRRAFYSWGWEEEIIYSGEGVIDSIELWAGGGGHSIRGRCYSLGEGGH